MVFFVLRLFIFGSSLVHFFLFIAITFRFLSVFLFVDVSFVSIHIHPHCAFGVFHYFSCAIDSFVIFLDVFFTFAKTKNFSSLFWMQWKSHYIEAYGLRCCLKNRRRKQDLKENEHENGRRKSKTPIFSRKE